MSSLKHLYRKSLFINTVPLPNSLSHGGSAVFYSFGRKYLRNFPLVPPVALYLWSQMQVGKVREPATPSELRITRAFDSLTNQYRYSR